MILSLRVRQASLSFKSVLAMALLMPLAARWKEPRARFSQVGFTPFSSPDCRTKSYHSYKLTNIFRSLLRNIKMTKTGPSKSMKRCETDLWELVDAFVDLDHSLGEDAAVPAHIQAEQVVVDQSQSHLTRELCRHRRHFTGVMVGFVIEVILAVQVGAVVSVGLSLWTQNTRESANQKKWSGWGHHVHLKVLLHLLPYLILLNRRVVAMLTLSVNIGYLFCNKTHVGGDEVERDGGNPREGQEGIGRVVHWHWPQSGYKEMMISNKVWQIHLSTAKRWLIQGNFYMAEYQTSSCHNVNVEPNPIKILWPWKLVIYLRIGLPVTFSHHIVHGARTKRTLHLCGRGKVNANTAGLCRTGSALGALLLRCYLFHRALEEAVEQWTCWGHKAPTTWRGDKLSQLIVTEKHLR